ncbi:hypothetical protein GN956_G13761 [Arapaima gigas]
MQTLLQVEKKLLKTKRTKTRGASRFEGRSRGGAVEQEVAAVSEHRDEGISVPKAPCSQPPGFPPFTSTS